MQPTSLSRRPFTRPLIVGLTSGLAWLAAVACGPSSERYYCDAAGCYQCDAYGCSAVAAPTHASCTGNASCPAGSVCTESGCAVQCVDDAACPRGEVCKDGTCSPPGSTSGPVKECTTKSDCGDGKACVAGACEACGGTNGPCPCETATECASGEQCVAKVCIPKASTCTYSSECGDGKVCADGQCLTGCTDAAPCGAGLTCDKGVCKPAPVQNGCTSDTSCPAEAPQCVAGTCVKACAADPECGEGNYCNQGACVVDTRPKPNCTSDDQCGGSAATPKKCLGGFCKYACTTDQYCRTIDSRIGYCAKDGVCRNASEANAQCLSSSDCTGGQSCVDNQCR